MQRVASWFAVLVTVVAVGVGVATPAQAWGYCNPIISSPYALNLYPKQGYCGNPWQTGPSFAWCYTMAGGPWNDKTAAIWNRTDYKVTVFQSDNCNYAYTWKDIAANTSDPDLYNDSLYHNISSVKFWP